MNYLIHLYLAGPEPMCRLGAIMGDFVKGPLPTDLPEMIHKGLKHHRRIDSLAHRSPHTRSSRQRLSPRYGHARSILVDIFYDHLLARSWSSFSDQTLEDFARDVYKLLATENDQLPPGLQKIVPRMTDHNWLVSYRQEFSISRALSWIASRLSRSLPLAEAVDDLRLHEEELMGDFKLFMEEAVDLGRTEFGITL